MLTLILIFFSNHKVSVDSDHLGPFIPLCVYRALELGHLQTYASGSCLPLIVLMTVGSKGKSPLGEDGMANIIYCPQLSVLIPRKGIFTSA